MAEASSDDGSSTIHEEPEMGSVLPGLVLPSFSVKPDVIDRSVRDRSQDIDELKQIVDRILLDLRSERKANAGWQHLTSDLVSRMDHIYTAVGKLTEVTKQQANERAEEARQRKVRQERRDREKRERQDRSSDKGGLSVSEGSRRMEDEVKLDRTRKDGREVRAKERVERPPPPVRAKVKPKVKIGLLEAVFLPESRLKARRQGRKG